MPVIASIPLLAQGDFEPWIAVIVIVVSILGSLAKKLGEAATAKKDAANKAPRRHPTAFPPVVGPFAPPARPAAPPARSLRPMTPSPTPQRRPPTAPRPARPVTPQARRPMPPKPAGPPTTARPTLASSRPAPKDSVYDQDDVLHEALPSERGAHAELPRVDSIRPGRVKHETMPSETPAKALLGATAVRTHRSLTTTVSKDNAAAVVAADAAYDHAMGPTFEFLADFRRASPATLRRAFLMTEILGQPLALRAE